MASAPLAPILDSFPSKAAPPVISTANSSKPPITCHVLDTRAGIPAGNIPVTLTLIEPNGPSQALKGCTNSDGRVTAWDAPANGASIQEMFESAAGKKKEEQGDAARTAPLVLVWALKFNVGEYFKGEGFWTDVEIRFKTEVEEGEGKREHWHVPLLLSPWSYTTYRGS